GKVGASGNPPPVTPSPGDLPAALDDRGGWLNPDIAPWFADYARVVFEALGDRVDLWMTINEPWVVVDGGYLFGANAPGHRNLFEAPIASHHLLCAHALAVQAFRASRRGEIGLVVNLEPKDPATDSPEDVAATRRSDAYMNERYLDRVFRGTYREAMAEIFGEAWPEFDERELRLIREPMDFLGINYYRRGVMRHDAAAPPVRASHVRVPGSEYTETD